MAVLGSCLHRIRASLHIIAQGFGFTRDFLKERNNSAYCRLKKIHCEFKEQARARHPGEKCGLGARFYLITGVNVCIYPKKPT
jgi:hypothetical protein